MPDINKSAVRLTIEWTERPGCAGHSRPCEGCSSFCHITKDNAEELGHYALYEAYGDFNCQGDHWHHQTTVWVAEQYVSPTFFLGLGRTFYGFGQSETEAITDLNIHVLEYEAEVAAKALRETPEEP